MGSRSESMDNTKQKILEKIASGKMTRSQAIHAKCIDCCCWQPYEVRKCTLKTCPLWVFRNGTKVGEQEDNGD